MQAVCCGERTYKKSGEKLEIERAITEKKPAKYDGEK
jgi:hypothetical protein